MDSETLTKISIAIDRMQQIKRLLEYNFDEKHTLTVSSTSRNCGDLVTFDPNSHFEAYGRGHAVILKLVRDALDAEYEELRRGLADFGVTVEESK